MAIVHDFVSLFWLGLIVVAISILLGLEGILKVGISIAALGLLGTALLSGVEYYIDNRHQEASE